MKIKEFLGKMNFNSTAVVELCDVNISLDNRTRISLVDVVKGDCGGFGKMRLQSFSIVSDKLTIYAE